MSGVSRKDHASASLQRDQEWRFAMTYPGQASAIAPGMTARALTLEAKLTSVAAH